MDTLAWVGGGLVVVGLVIRHLSTHNRRVCPRCKGAGRLKSGVFGERYRQCPRCKGETYVRGWLGRSE